MNRAASLQKKKRARPNGNAERDGTRPVFVNSLKGLAAGIVSAILILLVMCAVAMKTPDPAALARPLSFASLLFSALIAGFVSAKLSSGGALCGVICGAMYLAFVFAVSLFVRGGGQTNLFVSLALRLAAFPATVLGAIIGDRKEKKPKRRKRH